MIEKYEKFLPIGSVVILKNSPKKTMIIGYAQIDINMPDKVYDYMGCFYPEGVLNTSESILFNHDNIDKILCLGYSDDDGKDWNNKIKELLTEDNINLMLNEAKKQKEVK